MLGITKDDFRLKGENFDPTQPWNLLRVICGAFLLPHAASKLAAGGLNPATVGFFGKAGFHPAEAWVLLAMLTEFGAAVALVLGLCTRFAALAAAGTLLAAAAALQMVKGFGWLWSLGGCEYPVFWALTAIAVAVHDFQRRARA